MRIATISHAAYAALMIALGILCLVHGNFSPVWEPIPKTTPAREALVYLCALISLGCGIGLLWKRAAAISARVLLAYLLLWFIAFRTPSMFVHPAQQNTWSGAGETAVVIAGAWVLYVWFAEQWDKLRFGFATGERGLRIARVFYGLALIPFGIAHFTYLHETVVLVPAWLPGSTIAYFTGGAYIVAGLAILLNVYARLAATLSAAQIGLFTVIVWIPIITASPNAFQWSEFIVSCALTAGAWLVSDSYRGARWLAVRGRG